MKNEVKLNIHMFFPEMLNDEISAEQHKALETLLALSELDQEDSVEKFTSELESRFELIKPILGDQTEEFLGYCQNDITKLSDFFAGRFVRFGMDAVAVQKILRNIWQQTPCEDKRLNYNLYKYIDEKFYSIVNERKRNISFKHIQPLSTRGISVSVLKKDWKMRRKHYAQELQIDIDYLDGEAIDGRIFPSASGLFANPAPQEIKSDFAILEFLNFWMPHYPEQLQEKDEFSERFLRLHIENSYNYFAETKDEWQRAYRLFFQLVRSYTQSSNELYTSAKNNVFDVVIKQLDEMSDDFLEKETQAFWQQSKNIFCQCIREQYAGLQPTSFLGQSLTNKDGTIQGTFDFETSLPQFINSCSEYDDYDFEFTRSAYKNLIFFRENNQIQKVYTPNNYFSTILEDYSMAFAAMEIALPDMTAPDFTQQLDKFFKYYNHSLIPRHLVLQSEDFALEKFICKSTWHRRVSTLFQLKQTKYWDLVKSYFDNVAKSNLRPNNLIRSLATIRERFIENLDPRTVPDVKNELELYMTEEIDKLKNNFKFPQNWSMSFSEKMDNIVRIDELEREQEKLELQGKEAETRAEEQKNIFSRINHDIKSTCGTVISSLDLLSSQSFTDEQNKLWKSAYIGAAFINSTATAISMSYRSNKDWNSDFESSDPADTNFKDIIYNAFTLVVPNMFVRDYSMYKNESEKYFPDKSIFSCATQEWFAGEIFEDREKWLNKYFGNFQLKFDASCNELKIGNKHGVVIHLFILFKELFLNAIKAAAWVDKEKRQFYFNFSIVDKILHIDIKNSSQTGIEKKEGLGLLIFSNYKEMFSIQNDISRFDNGVFFQHFEIPYGNSK